MKTAGRTLLLAVFALSYSLPVWSQSGLSSRTQERMDVARKSLQQAELTPEKNIAATAFFFRPAPPEEIFELVAEADLKVLAFRHGTTDYSGGYLLRPEEDLWQAIENYKKEHVAFLQKELDTIQRVMLDSPDPGIGLSLTQKLKRAEKRIADFQANGIAIIGIEVSGEVRDVVPLHNHSLVRMIEIKDGQAQPNFMPTDF